MYYRLGGQAFSPRAGFRPVHRPKADVSNDAAVRATLTLVRKFTIQQRVMITHSAPYYEY